MESVITSQSPKESKHRKLAVILLAAIVLTGVCGATLLLKIRSSGPIPKEIRESANFPIYLPEKLPVGYRIDGKSFRYESGVLFYEIKNSRDIINVSIQRVSKNPPNIDMLVENLKFKKIDQINGVGAAGTELGKPRVVFLNSTTIIMISSNTETPLDILLETVKNLAIK